MQRRGDRRFAVGFARFTPHNHVDHLWECRRGGQAKTSGTTSTKKKDREELIFGLSRRAVACQLAFYRRSIYM